MLVPLPSAAQPLPVLLARSPFLAVHYDASRRRVLLAKKEGSQHRSAKASDQADGKQQQQVFSTSHGLAWLAAVTAAAAAAAELLG